VKSFGVLVIVIALIAVGAVAVNHYYPNLLRPAQQPVAAVEPVTTVAALGRIRPEGGIIDVGADAVRRVARLMVDEGQTVKKGDILAYLDNYAEVMASVTYGESQLEGGKSQLKSRTALEQANIDKAELELKSVEQLTPLEIQVQEQTAEKNRLELALAQQEAKRLAALADKGSASREDADKKASEVAQKIIQVASAEAELKRMKAAFAINRAKAQASLDFARANLKYYQVNIDIESLVKNLDLTRTRMSNAIVQAPTDGQILKIRTRPGEVMRKEGVLTMGNLSTMEVLAEVYETDLMRLQPGQPAKITADALAEPLTGRVVVVGRLINRQTVFSVDPAAPTDARVAEVRIRLEQPEPAARLVNLQVTAIIDTAKGTRK
jgi:HlyD family secretion protein